METIFEIWFRLLVSASGGVLIFGGMLAYSFIQIGKEEKNEDA